MFLLFLGDIDLPYPILNDASAHMLRDSEIWVKNMHFLVKSMFLQCFEAFTHFPLSIRIDDNFLINLVIQLHTYCGLFILRT